MFFIWLVNKFKGKEGIVWRKNEICIKKRWKLLQFMKEHIFFHFYLFKKYRIETVSFAIANFSIPFILSMACISLSLCVCAYVCLCMQTIVVLLVDVARRREIEIELAFWSFIRKTNWWLQQMQAAVAAAAVKSN